MRLYGRDCAFVPFAGSAFEGSSTKSDAAHVRSCTPSPSSSVRSPPGSTAARSGTSSARPSGPSNFRADASTWKWRLHRRSTTREAASSAASNRPSSSDPAIFNTPDPLNTSRETYALAMSAP